MHIIYNRFAITCNYNKFLYHNKYNSQNYLVIYDFFENFYNIDLNVVCSFFMPFYVLHLMFFILFQQRLKLRINVQVIFLHKLNIFETIEQLFRGSFSVS